MCGGLGKPFIWRKSDVFYNVTYNVTINGISNFGSYSAEIITG